VILQLDELGLRRVGGDENGLQLELVQLFPDLLGRPLQTRDLVAPRVQIVAASEVDGNVGTAEWRSSGRLKRVKMCCLL
jgi:hypothetical protein